MDFECTATFLRAGTLKIVDTGFHNSVRRLDTDVILYSRLECTLGFGHIYFRISASSLSACLAVCWMSRDTARRLWHFVSNRETENYKSWRYFPPPILFNIDKNFLPLLYRTNFHEMHLSRSVRIEEDEIFFEYYNLWNWTVFDTTKIVISRINFLSTPLEIYIYIYVCVRVRYYRSTHVYLMQIERACYVFDIEKGRERKNIYIIALKTIGGKIHFYANSFLVLVLYY